MVSAQVQKRVLLLSVGYGQGHHAAAAALAETYVKSGWEARVVDVCSMAHPFAFRLSQRFYQFCVRRMPWLWGVTYSLTDTANWAELVRLPFMRGIVRCLAHLLHEWRPDFVFWTYPRFAYMLDALLKQGGYSVPYAVVVTDALEISRPWMLTSAHMVFVTDEESRRRVVERYGLLDETVHATGFPVRQAFQVGAGYSGGEFRVLYGAFRSTHAVRSDIQALLETFPDLSMTVVAGTRSECLQRMFREFVDSGQLTVLKETNQMAEMMRSHHLYVGKAGAATMFECYSTGLPMLVNFALPGQEQGNLELLLADGAGGYVGTSSQLVETVRSLLMNEGAGLRALRENMLRAARSGGVSRIINLVNTHFS